MASFKALVLSICNGKEPNEDEKQMLLNIRSVDLSGTSLTSIDPLIPFIVNVQNLNLKNTKIEVIPRNINRLMKLEQLNLAGTLITSLPESVLMLSNLKRFYLNETLIEALPENISNLVNLEILCLDSTKISILPSGITNLGKLRILSLRNTPVVNLPNLHGRLTELRVLNLSSCRITELPESIDKLINLEKLILSYCPITSLPESIGRLSNLKELYLPFTPISQLPESIENLKLTELDFHFSKISNIDIISHNEKLKGLDIGYTSIKDIPEFLLASETLEFLNISYTKIDVSKLISKRKNPIRIKATGMPIPSEQISKDVVIDASLDEQYYTDRIGYALEDTDKLKSLTTDFSNNRKQYLLVTALTNLLAKKKPDLVNIDSILFSLLISIRGEFDIQSLEADSLDLFLLEFLHYFKSLLKLDRLNNMQRLNSIIKETCPDILEHNTHILLDAIRQDIVLGNFSDDYDAKSIMYMLAYSKFNKNNLTIRDERKDLNIYEDVNGFSDELKNLKFQYIDIPVLSEVFVRYMQNFIERAENVRFRFTQSEAVKNKQTLLINVGYDNSHRKISMYVSFQNGVRYWIENLGSDNKIINELIIDISLEVKNDTISINMSYPGNEHNEMKMSFLMDISENYYSKQTSEFNTKFGRLNSIDFEILYLYVQNYRNLTAKEYIFNNQYVISLDFQRHSFLIVDKKDEMPQRSDPLSDSNDYAPQRPQTFFGKGISNIISFVGKNGTGKSSIIELFLNSKIFNPDGNYEEAEDYILVFRRGDHIYWSDKNDTWSESTSLGTKLSSNISSNEYYRIVNTKVVLISNIVDAQRLSTNEKYDNRDSRKIILTTQNILNGGEIPNADIYRIINYYLYDKLYRKAHENRAPVHGIILRNIRLSFKDNVTEENIREYYHKIVEKYKQLPMTVSIDNLVNILSKNPFVRSLQIAFILNKIDSFSSFEEANTWIESNIQNKYNNSLIMMLNTRKVLDLNTIDTGELIRLVDLISNDAFLSSSITLGFSDMSSGESARLTIFARVLSLFTMQGLMPDALKYGRGGNYVIYFDEAELYFHPSWQRTLVNDMITFLDTLNENNEYYDNVTLYFSSNSPFLLSDLPNTNVKYFQVADEEIVDERTFGQNIHILLKNSFFMDEGVTGEFAKRRIKQVLDIINSNKKPSSKDVQLVNYICEILGEPILRRVISDEWHNKQNDFRS